MASARWHGVRSWSTCRRLGTGLALALAVTVGAAPSAEAAKSPTRSGPEAVAAARDGCRAEGNAILVRVHGVHNTDGQVVAVLYGDDPDSFLKNGKRLARTVVPAAAETVALCLPSPGQGTFAVAAFHDEDSDLRLSKDFFGLPAEGWGLSDNPPFKLRRPRFDEAAFHVRPGIFVIDINLRY
jgi:uncharacterized protein (DUF2141 family)